MKFITSLLILLWPLYQLSQIPFVRVYMVDLVIFLTLLTQSKKIKLNHPQFKSFLSFLFVATGSLLIAYISGSGTLIAVFYLARLSLYSSLLLISLPKKTPSLLNISFFMIPVLGLLQYLFFPDLRFLKTIGYDDHYFRLTFPFLDPNYTGAFLAFISFYSLKTKKWLTSRWAFSWTWNSLSFLVFRLPYSS